MITLGAYLKVRASKRGKCEREKREESKESQGESKKDGRESKESQRESKRCNIYAVQRYGTQCNVRVYP